MSMHDPRSVLGNGGVFPGGSIRIPSEEEKRQALFVQGLQVRTQAAAFASQLLQGKDPTGGEWRDLARVIEQFIWGDDPPGR